MKATIEEMGKEQETMRDNLSMSERKAAFAANEAEEARTWHQIAERQKKQIESELTSVKEVLQEAHCLNNAIGAAKRSLESEVASLKADCEEMAFALRNAEEKAKQAVLDAIRWAILQTLANCLLIS